MFIAHFRYIGESIEDMNCMSAILASWRACMPLYMSLYIYVCVCMCVCVCVCVYLQGVRANPMGFRCLEVYIDILC
jgi:hypothetical protein